MNAKVTRWTIVIAGNLLIFAGLFTAFELFVRSLLCETLACDKFEIFTRHFPGERTHQRPRLHPAALLDDDLGWRLDSDFTPPPPDTYARLWLKDYRVNRDGFRDDEDFAVAAARKDPPRIMVLGDSFVYGTGIERSALLTSVLERRFDGRYRVYNAGVPRYGIDQMLLAYKKYTPVLEPHIVLLVYIDADFSRALQALRPDFAEKPMLELCDGELALRTTGPPLPELMARRSLVLNKLYLRLSIHPEERRLHRAIFSELIRLTGHAGRRLLVLRYPDHSQLKNGRREERHDFSEFFREHSVPYYDPFEEVQNLGVQLFYEFYQWDAHPTRMGNEFMVEYLMREGFPVKNDPPPL